jgi:hypothetical protein
MTIKSLATIASLFLLTSCLVHTVNFPESKNHIQTFEDTSGPKQELFTKASAWVAGIVNNPESSIQHSDANQGVLIIKYLMSGQRTTVGGLTDTRIFATVDVRVADNKSRIEIKPQPNWQYDPHGMSEYKFGEIDAVLDMRKLAESFHQALLKPSVEL